MCNLINEATQGGRRLGVRAVGNYQRALVLVLIKFKQVLQNLVESQVSGERKDLDWILGIG